MKNIFIISLVLGTCSAFQLPPYIHKCNLSDPQIGECIVSQVPNVKPHLKTGIKELGVPSLVPFHIPKLSIDAGQNLKIEMSNLEILNLDQFDLKANHVSVVENRANYSFYFERLEVLGTYDMNGRIMILPIKGHGAANITLHKFHANYIFVYKIVEKKGNVYFEFPKQSFSFRSGKISLHFENLFNGDKVLGDQMNLFLNENWKDVEDLLRPGVTDILLAIVAGIFNPLLDIVPAKELFDF